MGDGAERQGLQGGRSFLFCGLARDESSQPSTPMNMGREGGLWGKGEVFSLSC